MAKKTEKVAKKKATKKKATKKKAVSEPNLTPKLTTCPYVAEFTQPHPTESSGKLASKLTDLLAAIKEWTTNVRKAYAAKTNVPDFPISKFVNPNFGKLSRSAYDKIVAIYESGEDIEFLPRYNPILVDLVHAQRCVSLRRGCKKNNGEPPKNWDNKKYGSWYHEYDEDGKTVKDASLWFFDKKMPRRCHAETAESLVENPKDNILTFSGNRYVVGTGTHDEAAAFMIWGTSHGNYRAGDRTRKRMSLAGIKEVRDIVFKIEDKPNNGGGVTVVGEWQDIKEMVYMPGQVLTAGFLSANGKKLTAKEIRGLDSDTKNLKFKVLDAPIIGEAIAWDDMWADIQSANRAAIKAMKDRDGRSEEYEAGDPQTKSITNILVNAKRSQPSEQFPFGLRSSQAHMIAYVVATGDGKMEEGYFKVGVVIGARANTPYNVGVHKAKSKSKVKVKTTPKKSDAAAPIENEAEEEAVSKAEAVSS